jgi:hypothetical protein
MPEIVCESRIRHVALYGRGAVVTRRVSLPRSVPAGEVDLVVPAITPLATLGSARATLGTKKDDGGRDVLLVRTRILVPENAAAPGDVVERVRTLGLERERIDLERRYAYARREALAQITPVPKLDSPWRRLDPDPRVKDAFVAGNLVEELVATIDRRLLELEDLLFENGRALEKAQLAASQAKSQERSGEDRPTIEIVVRLGARANAEADATEASLDVSYAVDAARWWPAYSVRLEAGGAGSKAAWALDAVVHQATGEDWNGVALSLTSVELARDARLPELASFRLGRAQPAPSKGYRPLPEGLDALFEGYDRAMARLPSPPAQRPAPAPRRAPKPATGAVETRAVDDLDTAPMQTLSRERVMSETIPAPLPPPPRAAPGMMFGGAPAPQAARSMPMPASMAMPDGIGLPKAKKTRGRQESAAEIGSLQEEGDELGTTHARGPEGPLVPEDGWLDFDRLALPEMSDRSSRGRLVQDVSAGGTSVRNLALLAQGRLSAVTPTRYAIDPRELGWRGNQIMYEAAVHADIASNALPHRVSVLAAEGKATSRLLVVPRESTSVFRESTTVNPFGVALLPGPTDVFVDGALLTTSAIGVVGVGGKIALGLGVEERVRAARNARTDETSAGLLGGKTAIETTVTIELTSALGQTTAIDVYDRLPSTEDKDVEIELPRSTPRAERYNQSERGEPVRGGLSWQLELGAGGKARVEYTYRITLPAKSELRGGNRRD